MAEPSTAPVQRGPTSGVHRAVSEPKPPLLASEVLREEIAPLQPGREQCRMWLTLVALALTALGIALRLGVGIPSLRGDAATMAFSASGALVAVAILPFPYALRAAVALVIGATLMVLGLRMDGPLAGLTIDGNLPRTAARLVTITVLPAALMFRARYPAFRRARVLLALALAISAPFLVLEGMLAFDASAPWAARGGAIGSIVLAQTALFGFMGQGTTGWGGLWAALLLAGLPVGVGLRQLTLADATTGYLTYPATAIGLVCAAALTSLGLFQLMAFVWAPAARKASTVGPKKEPDPPSDPPSSNRA